MSRFSNIVNYTSVDGLPSNPYPLKAVRKPCVECGAKIDTEICPYCEAENEIEHEPDYEAGDREYDDD